MNVTDWDEWMKEHHIYIPTTEEMEKARKNNLAKIEKIRREHEALGKCPESFKRRIADHE